MENVNIAKKLINVRRSKDVDLKLLNDDYQRHQKNKALICKLPLIDMTKNLFSPKINILSSKVNQNQYQTDRNIHLKDSLAKINVRKKHQKRTLKDSADESILNSALHHGHLASSHSRHQLKLQENAQNRIASQVYRSNPDAVG